MKQTTLYTTLMTLTFLLIVSVTFLYTQAGVTQTSGEATTTAEVANTAPAVDSIFISDTPFALTDTYTNGIQTNIGTDKTIHINGILSDANGENDIASTSLVFHRTAVTNTCTQDNNDCYQNSTAQTCTLNAAYGDSTQVAFNCPVDLAYWTDATDSSGRYPDDTWTAYVSVTDTQSSASSLTKQTEVNSVLALDIPETIQYGTFSLGATTTDQSNVPMELTQLANTKADVELSGTDMTCDVLGSIPTGNQKWSLTDVGYSNQDTTSLTGSATAAGRDVGYRESESAELTASLYWNIGIPATGVRGVCEGSNTISVIALGVSSSSGGGAFVSGGISISSAAIVDGKLYTWGYNNEGQLGNGSTVGSNVPVQVGSDTDWSSVVMGRFHALATKTDGTLWSWGDGSYGKLGHGNSTNFLTPTQVGTDTDWDIITVGYYHTLARKTDGTLYAWGRNTEGQLGLGDTTNRTSPTQVGTDTDWAAIEAGQTFSVLLKTDDTLWTAGFNTDGQLGQGDTSTRNTFTQVTGAWSSASAGLNHVVAKQTDGSIYAWGDNAYGQLGLGDKTDRTSPVQVGTDTNWDSVIGGGLHSLAIKTDGTLWGWGRGANGQLGTGDTNERLTPTQAGTDTDWAFAGAGYYHSLMEKTDGTLWSTGYNNSGQLGLGDNTNRSTPTQITSF